MHLRDLTQFLTELSKNNNRAWFVMNKPRYDILRTEFLALVTQLIGDLSCFDPEIADCNPRKALFRIHRDMRFSKNKEPYKTSFSAAITANGLKKPSQGGGPAYYFHIDANATLLVAGGEYMPPAARLKTIREHVVTDAKGFEKVIADRKLRKRYGDLQEEGKLLRPPKGFDADAPHLEYLKRKSFIVWTEHSTINMPPDECHDQIAEGFHDAFPLINWLRKAK